jgi:hypothetical protein
MWASGRLRAGTEERDSLPLLPWYRSRFIGRVIVPPACGREIGQAPVHWAKAPD